LRTHIGAEVWALEFKLKEGATLPYAVGWMAAISRHPALRPQHGEHHLDYVQL